MGKLLLALGVAWGQTPILDAPPGSLQLDYYPKDGARVATNPPAFVWVPVPGAARYVVQVSRSADFSDADTTVLASEITLQVPRRTLQPGTWYWRYGALTAATAQPVFSRVRRFEIAEDALSLPFPDVGELVERLSGIHPRIVVRAAELPQVRARAKGDLQSAVRPVLAAAEKTIAGPLLAEPAFLPPPGNPTRGEQYQRAFMVLRPFLAEMVASADAYLLSGDERYGQEARRRLVHVMNWDPEGSTSLKNNDEAGMSLPLAMARTYDYIYPLLSDKERNETGAVMAVRLRQIYDALRKRPFESKPFESHALGSYLNNLTEALLVMAGDLDVESMLEYALLQFWSPYYPPFGGEDGGWSEGPSYWSWSTAKFVRTFALIEQITGLQISQRPWLRNTPYFKLYGNPPYSKLSPFGDGQERGVVGFDTMYYLATILRDPYALWYSTQARNGPFRPRGLDALLFQAEELKPSPPDRLPQARLFADVGLAAMHSALADATRNVQVLLRSSPFGSTSHSYADQNAFVLHAFGEPLAISSGYYEYWGSPHHREWTWQSKAHNTILVDGEGQRPQSIASKGRIARFATNDYAHYAMGDAHQAYSGRLDRFDRHVVFLRPRDPDQAMVVIFDDLQGRKASTYQWLLHALEEMAVNSEASSVSIQRGSARLEVRFLAPAGLRFEQTNLFPENPNNEFMQFMRGWQPQWHLTVTPDTPSERQEFLTVLLPYIDGGETALAETRLVDGTGCRAVELRTASARHVILFRRAGHEGAMEADGLRSNAAVLATGFDADGQTIGRIEVE